MIYVTFPILVTFCFICEQLIMLVTLNTSENSSWIFPYNDISVINWINFPFSIISLLENVATFCIFIKTKELYGSLYYRFVFTISGLHAILVATFASDFITALARTNGSKYHCIILDTIAAFTYAASSFQLAVIAADRFQASFPMTTSLLQKRRVIMGYFVLTFDIGLVISVCSSAVYFGNTDNTNCLVTSIQISFAQLQGVWTLSCIFIAAIPFCFATLYRIKKTLKTIGLETNVLNVRPLNGLSCPATSVQRAFKKKLQAYKAICLLVSVHVGSHLPLFIFILINCGRPDYFETLYQISWTTILIQTILDPVIIFYTSHLFRQQVCCC